MQIGSAIKIHRIKKNMTQEELAYGIISVSYLSKIENLQTTASENVIKLLCGKLGISTTIRKNNKHYELCYDWFSQLQTPSVNNYDLNIDDILHVLNDTEDGELSLLIEIHFIQYYLHKGDLKAALHKIEQIKGMTTALSNIHHYYWNKFSGNYHWTMKSYNEALTYYIIAYGNVHKLDSNTFEIADINYLLGITYSKLLNTSATIEHIQKAIVLFKDNYELYRCTQCHISLGVAYRKSHQYEKAETHYKTALNLANKLNNKELNQLIHLNLVFFYSRQNNFAEAEEHGKLSLELGSEVTEQDLYMSVHFIENYFERGDMNNAERWINTGEKLLSTIDNEKVMKYKIMLKIYQHKMKSEEAAIDLLMHDLLPYLQKESLYADLAKYSTQLSEYYESKKQYKKALKFQKVSSNCLKKLVYN
ncbi:tetratricopeptide repeat protein [Cytobacillus sp. Hm23]